MSDTLSLGVDAMSDALLAFFIMIQLSPRWTHLTILLFDRADDDDHVEDMTADDFSLHEPTGSSCLRLEFQKAYDLATSGISDRSHGPHFTLF